MTVDVVRSAQLDGIRHGFLGRSGGVSTGIYAGLNVGLGSDDDREAILENRRRAVAAVAPGAKLVTPHQVHSATAITVTEPFPDDARPHADALVTDRPGLLIGILTADCVPVLFADRAAGIVGATHAGWKGALGGVTDATLDAMVALGADRTRIVAAIGPCIARASYEVDTSFRDRFTAHDPENERFFREGRRDDHHQFDIESYVAHRLATAGVTRIDALGLDTYALANRFYSYRRATHRAEPGYGRQMSVIAAD
ncbi:peptidoglycan editing factor PgeF [Sphingomonas arantia]|uniref:Purine nucleoside phosphorylase n=1 Tax=Sphingomonas arantia TaxID=1460676 RepID=A0ABW4TTR7_9SPHN